MTAGKPNQDLAVSGASDVPALLERGERALEAVTNSDEGELLWRELTAIEHAARLARVHADVQLRVGRLKLRAERRWGELLGPAENRGPATLTASKGSTGADHSARHKARQVADVPADVFDKYLATVKDPETLRRARLLRVAREAAAEDRRDEAEHGAIFRRGEVEIRHGDIRTSLADLTGQVDAIITDPPYPAEFLDEWDALGEIAADLLTPNGVVVAMAGQTHLPTYLAALARHLSYRWCGAYLIDGPAARVHGRKVGTKWKPLLIFDRGNERPFLIQDTFTSVGDDKRHHHWGQSESGIADVVERFTESGQLVVDPFLGGGTTAVVCRDLGRRFVGCDIDADAVHTTDERLAA